MDTPLSAGRLAEQLGDRVPPAASVLAESFDLAVSVRRLVEAVVMTDVSAAERRWAAEQIAAVTDALTTRRRADAVLIVRHPDGRVESLMQAAAGRLNPQALPIEWVQ